MLSLILAASLLAAPARADLRTWVVTPPDPLRERIGTPSIEGTLVAVRGFDAEHSRAVAILRRPDGSLRSVTAAWLDPESRAIVDAWPDPRPERRHRRTTEPPIPARDDIYPRQGPGAAGIERHETENFVFHRGSRRDGSGAAWFEPWQHANPQALVFSNARFLIIATHRSASPDAAHAVPEAVR